MKKTQIHCPPIVYIQGEEMTRYAMQLFLDKCIKKILLYIINVWIRRNVQRNFITLL